MMARWCSLRLFLLQLLAFLCIRKSLPFSFTPLYRTKPCAKWSTILKKHRAEIIIQIKRPTNRFEVRLHSTSSSSDSEDGKSKGNQMNGDTEEEANEARANATKLRRKKRAENKNGVVPPPRDVEDLVTEIPTFPAKVEDFDKLNAKLAQDGDDGKLLFPEMQQAGIDEKALRASPVGKVIFGVLDNLFPVFREPNWFDVYDPPLNAKENLELPYFDGYDFVNSSWTIYIRHRYGAFNWLDRMGLIPQAVHRVFMRPDGKTMWSDGFYGDWYINPAINYFQFEKHFGRGAGYTQYSRGMRIFQVQRWNFEHEVGRYWNRGLRSYLRNETNFYALEGRIWGTGVKWRPFPRDQGKFLAIRDGTNLTEVFGSLDKTPWQERFEHAMTLPFYQAHPDQLERIEDNFDQFYTNLLDKEIR